MSKESENISSTLSAKKIKKPMSKDKKRSVFIMLALMILAIAVWIVGIVFLDYGKSVDEVKAEIFPHTAFEFSLFGNTYAISQSIVSGWITVGFLIFVAVLFRIFIVPRFSTVPKSIQAFAEWLIESFNGMAKNNVGHVASQMGPIVFAMSSFICVGTLMELLGIRPPNADINTCIALGITTFILINYFGLKEKGLKGRLLHYIKPVPIIPLITDIAVPVSLSFRLFGAILSGFIMMAIVWVAMPAVVPGFLSILFTCFHALIQAYIFAVLSLTFVGEAIE